MEENNLWEAVIEASVNAVTMFALSLGLLILGKQSGQLASDISMQYILLQASAVGLIRFASYLYANEEDVSPGEAIEHVIPAGTSKGVFIVRQFFRKHPVGKLI